MTLIKTSILSLISTVIKLLTGLVINKAVAIYIGPSGLALIGQFQNFMQLAMTTAQGGINSGVTKYTAEYKGDIEQLTPLFSTAFRISLYCSVIVSLAMIVFSKLAAEHFLDNSEQAYIFVLFGITIALFVINQLILSIVNGLKEITFFIKVSIIQSIYSLVFTTLWIVFYGLNGALIAFVTNQSVVLIIVLWLLRNHNVIKINNFKNRFDKVQARKLLGYSLMALTSVATVPVSQLIIRNHIGETIGWDQAGYWQGVWYISSMYLMVVTTALSIYYLPKLSEIKDDFELRKELFTGYKLILPIVIIMSLSIYFLKDFIIYLLFTPEFEPMRELFAWQLVGNVIKIASWLLAYVMLAKAMVRLYIITEVFSSALFVVLSIYLSNIYGVIGVTYAFAINYAVYFLLMIWVMRDKFILK